MSRRRFLRSFLRSAVLIIPVLIGAAQKPATAGTSLSANNIFLEAPLISSGGYPPHSVAVADVNGDCKPDLIVANQCATSINCVNQNGAVAVLLGNGDGTFEPAVIYDSGGQGTTSVAVA